MGDDGDGSSTASSENQTVVPVQAAGISPEAMESLRATMYREMGLSPAQIAAVKATVLNPTLSVYIPYDESMIKPAELVRSKLSEQDAVTTMMMFYYKVDSQNITPETIISAMLKLIPTKATSSATPAFTGRVTLEHLSQINLETYAWAEQGVPDLPRLASARLIAGYLCRLITKKEDKVLAALSRAPSMAGTLSAAPLKATGLTGPDLILLKPFLNTGFNVTRTLVLGIIEDQDREQVIWRTCHLQLRGYAMTPVMLFAKVATQYFTGQKLEDVCCQVHNTVYSAELQRMMSAMTKLIASADPKSNFQQRSWPFCKLMFSSVETNLSISANPEISKFFQLFLIQNGVKGMEELNVPPSQFESAYRAHIEVLKKINARPAEECRNARSETGHYYS